MGRGTRHPKPRSLAIAAALCLQAACSSRSPAVSFPPDHRFASEEVQADFAVARRALTEGHAALHRYRSPDEVEGILDRAAGALSRPTNAAGIWRVLTVAFAEIQDGHLSVLPNDAIYTAYFRSPGHMIPLDLALIDDRLYVIRNHDPGGLPPPGSEILRVNGKETVEILGAILDHIPVDGEVRSRGRHVAGRDFGLLAALILDFPGFYNLDYRDESGAAGSAKVSTLSYGALLKLRDRDRAEDPPSDPLTLEFLDEKRTAVMRVGTFAKDGDHDVPAFLSSSFKRIEKRPVEHLVIDLRGNGGGRDSLGALLYRYIARDDFRWVEHRAINHRHFEFIESTPEHWLNLRLRFISKRKAPDGRWHLHEDLDEAQEPMKNAVLEAALSRTERAQDTN